MATDDWEEFRKAVRKIPPPISCFSNGAVCPWCGHLHATPTFGGNHCSECSRFFCFGYPEWTDSKEPVSWVNFPHREFDALGGKADHLSNWEPTDLLKEHYHQKVEERTGIHSDAERPN